MPYNISVWFLRFYCGRLSSQICDEGRSLDHELVQHDLLALVVRSTEEERELRSRPTDLSSERPLRRDILLPCADDPTH
eukprot:6187031-Prymnesium_polylepis.1